MKRIFLVASILLMAISSGKSFALTVPPPPIDIDISNSNFEIIDSHQFRIRQILAPGYSGTYWADFMWNADQLLFQATMNVGKESSDSSGKPGVAIVGKSNGDYPDPIAAMNDIATWCGTPSETNPCLIKILPGVYDIGTNALQMMPYVDIEGSGENITKIKGGGPSAVIRGNSFTELRFLTVEHTGGAESSIAISGSPSQRLTSITIISTSGNNTNFGVNYENDFMSPVTPPLRMKNLTILVMGGAFNVGVLNGFNGGSIIIEHSSITGATNSIYGLTTFVAITQLNGPVGGIGPTTCAGVYDENFVFYANTCP